MLGLVESSKYPLYTHEFAYFVFPTVGEYIGFANREDNLVSPLRDWGGTSARALAKTCFYPIYVKNSEIVKFGDVCQDSFHPKKSNIEDNGIVAVYPVDNEGNERKWVFSRNSVEKNQNQLFVKEKDGEVVIMRSKSFRKYRTVWDDKKYYANIYGSKLITNMFGKQPFSFPKSIHTVSDSIEAISTVTKEDSILDYFAGSGTTGHAVININRKDGGKRKYILVEMGGYFDTVTKPRIQKVVYSKEWKEGKPVALPGAKIITEKSKRQEGFTLIEETKISLAKDENHSPSNPFEGISHCFKYIRLESYEDALANIRLKRSVAQQSLLDGADSFRESYMLGYMLDTEAAGSASLLDIDAFEDPFNYKLLVGTGSVGETKPVNVDLVETFNWLLGLRVKHINRIGGFQVVEGENPKGEKVLVIWRNLKETSNDDLDAFFKKQAYNTLDMEFDLVYVNGDNNLMNIPVVPEEEGTEPRYKVRLIEEEFKRLMFDVKDV